MKHQRRSRSPFRNRWAERMDRDESSLSAAAMWAFYMVGAVLLIGATMGILVSVVFLFGNSGGGVGVRLAAVTGLVGSVGAFLVGRTLTDDYRIYPNSHKS